MNTRAALVGGGGEGKGADASLQPKQTNKQTILKSDPTITIFRNREVIHQLIYIQNDLILCNHSSQYLPFCHWEEL